MATPSVELSSYRDQHFKVIYIKIPNHLDEMYKSNLTSNNTKLY